jgi:hypothetical protein
MILLKQPFIIKVKKIKHQLNNNCIFLFIICILYMTDYQEKYLKYKNKYNILKNNINYQNGGTKTFDLNKTHNYFIPEDVQQNLKILEQMFGNNFFIKCEEININVTFDKLSHRPYNDLSFYRLKFINNESSKSGGFTIDFINPLNFDLSDISCLNNLMKTEEYSGSQLVQFALQINKVLKVKKIMLGDEASLSCNGAKIDLSFQKLIESKKTYYMKLGFEIEISNSNFYLTKITNKETILHLIDTLVDSIRSITTISIINECNQIIKLISTAIKDNYSKNFEIKKLTPSPYLDDDVIVDNPKKNISTILNNCVEILNILNEYKTHEFIYEILTIIFKEKCEKYITLINYFFDRTVSITYGTKNISRNYIDNFLVLRGIKNDCLYSHNL